MYDGSDVFSPFKFMINRSDLMQIIYVLAGVKPAVRFGISEKYFKYLRKTFGALGLFVMKSNFYVRDQITCRGAKYTYSRSFSPVSKDPQIFVYVSKDKALCLTLRESEMHNDDISFGKLLGYPECCVEHFASHRYTKPGDFFISTLHEQECSSFSFLNNFALCIFDIKILCHYPCSPDCARSLKLAGMYLKVLRSRFSAYAAFLKRQLKSMIICTRSGSLVYSNKYSKRGQKIVFDEINGQMGDPLFKMVSGNEFVNIGRNGVKVGNKTLKDANTKIILYE